MDISTEQYKKEVQTIIRLKEIIMEDIRIDIERSKQNIQFERAKISVNEERLEIEQQVVENMKLRLSELSTQF